MVIFLKKYVFLAASIMIVVPLFQTAKAQEKLDSIRRIVCSMPDDTAKLANLQYVCKYIYNVDSAGKYCKMMVNLAQNLGETEYLAHAYDYLTRYYMWVLDYENAMQATMEALYLWEEIDDKNHLALMYMTLAQILAIEGQYASATRYFHESLGTFRTLGDTMHITQVLQNLGDVNIRVRSFDQALDYYSQAVTLDSTIDNKYGLIADNIGIGRVYMNKYKRQKPDSNLYEALDKSRYHFVTAYNMALPLPNIIEMHQLHRYLALLYMEIASISSAEGFTAMLDSCESHCRQLQELRATYHIKSNQTGITVILAKDQILRGNYAKASALLDDAAVFIAKEKPAREAMKDFYDVCRLLYERIGDYKKAEKCAMEINYLLMDSDNDESVEKLIKSKSQIEFDEKMRKHAIEEYEREQQYKARAQRQRTLLIFIISSLAVISAVVFFSSFRRKKLNNLLQNKNAMLDEKNCQLEAAKEKLSTQNDLLNMANKNITDSIVYAKHIQEAVIPTDDMMRQIFGECFVFFSPCNIVSGDFYWAMQIGRYKAFAVADCTGHGVPGALMSMLGISMLNDIVANADMDSERLQASDILEAMRNNVMSALRQDMTVDGSFDGMDMALVLIDADRHLLQYSGAFRPLVTIRGGELTVISADRMPLGVFKGRCGSFTNHELTIEPGDCIYAYSDGITDQFGGSADMQKFGRNNLYNLLLENHHKPFSEQKEVCKETLGRWMHPNPDDIPVPQTDDMLLVGIRI